MQDPILDDLYKKDNPKTVGDTSLFPTPNSRLTAFLIDGLILLVIIELWWWIEWVWESFQWYDHWGVLLFPLYFTYMEGKYGNTFGQAFLHFKVVKVVDKKDISYRRAFVKNSWLWGLCFLLITKYTLELHLLGFWMEFPWYWRMPNQIEAFLPWYGLLYGLNLASLLFSTPARTLQEQLAGTVLVNTERKKDQLAEGY